jgi:hypothetical protein
MNRPSRPTDDRIRLMLRFMVGDACLFNTGLSLLSARTILKALGISLAAGLALVLLSGCNDESTSASEPADPIQIFKEAHVRDIASALNQAFDHFENQNFDVCIAFCNYVLSREPEYTVAQELAEDARTVKERVRFFDLLMAFANADTWAAGESLKEELDRASCPGEGTSFYFAKVQNWRKLADPEEGLLIPYQDTLRYPHLGIPEADLPPRSVGWSKMD